MSLDQIADVDIDSGVFKYILIKLKKPGAGDDESKLIVRGYKSCSYHQDVLEQTRHENGMKQLLLEVLGGGRIKHDGLKKQIVVYGESMQYGPANHQDAVNVLKKKYADYSVTVSDDA